MRTSLARSIPAIVAGSAASGFGFSLGRDIYRGTKRQLGWAIVYGLIIAFFVLPIAGTFVAFRMVALNYATQGAAWKARFGAVIVLAVSLVLGSVPLLFLGGLASDLTMGRDAFPVITSGPLYGIEYVTSRPILLVTGEGFDYGGSLIGDTWVIPKWILVGLLALAGMWSGLWSRAARARMYAAIDYNARFMTEAGLTEIGNGEFADSDGQHYRLEDRSDRQIVLFPIGRRNRRAYIDIDAGGRFIRWSGLIRI